MCDSKQTNSSSTTTTTATTPSSASSASSTSSTVDLAWEVRQLSILSVTQTVLTDFQFPAELNQLPCSTEAWCVRLQLNLSGSGDQLSYSIASNDLMYNNERYKLADTSARIMVTKKDTQWKWEVQQEAPVISQKTETVLFLSPSSDFFVSLTLLY